MAPLTAPHWETVTPTMHEVFRRIGEYAFARRFYLAGGTALALRLGHQRVWCSSRMRIATCSQTC
jgi:hypothetical protein